MDQYGYGHAGPHGPNTVQRLAEAAVAWIRSRKAVHWIMFLAGVALGAILG